VYLRTRHSFAQDAGGVNHQYDELSAKIDRVQGSVDRLQASVDHLRGEFYDTRRWVLTMWLGFAALFVEIALFK
jgi:hypothetical protein